MAFSARLIADIVRTVMAGGDLRRQRKKFRVHNL
jgi:hypothetical protein